MGKNRKSELEIFDPNLKDVIRIDSMEEWQVYNWVLELFELGVLKKYEYQPPEFNLTPKYQFIPFFNNPKKKIKSLLQSHIYTADFKLEFPIQYGELLSKYFKISEQMIQNDSIILYLDIKGTFQKNGGARTFSINQKLVYEKYGVYVQKVVPQDLFKELGIPVRCLRGYKGRPSKIFASYNFANTVFGK